MASAASGVLAQDHAGLARSLGELIEALDSDNTPRVKQDSIVALAGLREAARSAVPQLFALFDDEHPHVRSLAAWSITQIGFVDDPSIVRDLLEHARSHSDESVRLSALVALARPEATAPPEVVGALCAMIHEDPSRSIRRQALQTLGGGATLCAAGAELFVELICDEDDLRVRDAILALRPGIVIADETLVRRLLDLAIGRRRLDFHPLERSPAGTTRPFHLGTRVIRLLGHVGGPAAREVVEALLTLGYAGREYLENLMRLAPAHFDLILDALRVHGPPQKLVLRGLAWMDAQDAAEWVDPAVVPELVRLLDPTGEEPAGGRDLVVTALFRVVHVGDPAYVVPELLPLLLDTFRSYDQPEWLRRAAANGIARIGPAAALVAVPILLEHLPGLEGELEETTLAALGALGDPRAIPSLEQALDGQPPLQGAALRALRAFGPAAARSVARVALLLEHPYSWVRLEAVATLQAMGPAASAAAGPLVDLVAGEQHPDDWHQRLPARATEALEVILGKDSARDLLRAAGGRGGAKEEDPSD